MQTRQVQLVRETFSAIEPVASQVAALFYRHLFLEDPTLRPLFRGDMAAQGQRLMTMIGSAVELLERPDLLMPVLRQLGARHVRYGVDEAHYTTVGVALLRTLQEGLGSAFTAEVRDAWGAVYGVISGTMIEGARSSIAVAA